MPKWVKHTPRPRQPKSSPNQVVMSFHCAFQTKDFKAFLGPKPAPKGKKA